MYEVPIPKTNQYFVKHSSKPEMMIMMVMMMVVDLCRKHCVFSMGVGSSGVRLDRHFSRGTLPHAKPEGKPWFSVKGGVG